MKVKFRMTNSQVIRDASGRYACPNLYCWNEKSTGLYPPIGEKLDSGVIIGTTTCPNCEIELDWTWVLND